MHHFFVTPQQISGDKIRIEGGDVNHMKNVLRMKLHEKAEISDGESRTYLCEVEAYEEDVAVLQNWTKLEFDKKGNLTEIDCKQGTVPAKLIPQAIRNFLKENYPAQAVKKIEMNKNEYEVELANGLDLTFNKHFQVIDIDWWDNPILTDCFQKVHPKKWGDLHLMNPTNFPIPVRMRMVGGYFHL